jgi:peptidyl-dipeptidase Dcp
MGATALAARMGARPAMSDENPLLADWSGPYGGVPPFDRIEVEMFPSAFEASMNAYRTEVHGIADNPAPPTFENTLAALEDAGRAYGRVTSIFDVYTSTMNDKTVQKIDREWRPKMAAFSDEITQNEKLFRRIEAIYEAREKSGLSPEQQRLAWYYHTRFVREGARLGPDDKGVLSKYNQRLAELYAKFSQNQLHDEESYMLVLENEKDLAGLPGWLREAAAQSAKEKKLAGRWVVMNTRSAMEPFLTYADRRDLREKAWRLWIKRGDNPGEHDNNPVVVEILRLRAKRAKLLGYETYAHWRVQDEMAKTPERAMDLMMKVWPAAVARVRQEVADMQAVADNEGAKLTIEPWDYRYYAEKVRKAKYDIDENEIKPYLQLEKIRDAVFWASGQLYGYQYREVHGLPTVKPDVRTWEVSDADGKVIGVWYWDPYARDGKSSGAWMNEYREQERFRKPILTIVSNNSNFVKAAPGAPVLISWDDADTTFHEFGHAIHGLSSSVSYPSLSGTNVARDYVEFPSQLNEHWLSTPEVLKRFAIHYKSGQPMSPELVARIHRASTFNQGFATVEYLASGIVDMKLHLAGDVPIDPHRFEQETLAAIGMPKEIVMRHRIPHFGHIFSDDGYAAGYYSYIWSEVLDHDAYQAFLEAGGPYDKAVAKRLHDCVLKVGNTVDPAVAYRNFRGKDPSIEPLLRYRGFPTD